MTQRRKTYKREVASAVLGLWMVSYIYVLIRTDYVSETAAMVMADMVASASVPVFALVMAMFGVDAYSKQIRHDQVLQENAKG